jgi:hypothetical protein
MMILHHMRHGRQDNHANNHVRCTKTQGRAKQKAYRGQTKQNHIQCNSQTTSATLYSHIGQRLLPVCVWQRCLVLVQRYFRGGPNVAPSLERGCLHELNWTARAHMLTISMCMNENHIVKPKGTKVNRFRLRALSMANILFNSPSVHSL